MEIELNYYEDFLHVAVVTYKEIEKLEKEHNELQVNTSVSEKSSDDFVDKVAENREAYEKCTSVCSSVLVDDYITLHLCNEECKNRFLNQT